MPGAVRLSTVLLILAWVVLGGTVTTQFVTPTGRNLLTAGIVIALVVGVIYGVGRWMAQHNPFHQEVVIRGVMRSLRRRTNLET